MTKNFACAFIGEKKSIYQRREDVFDFKVTYQYIPSIVITIRHSVVIAAEPSVVTLVVNISTDITSTGKAYKRVRIPILIYT